MIYLVPLNPNFYWQKFGFFLMNNDEFFVHKLERHQTKDVSDSHVNGELTVVWRDWDDIVKDHPKMIYLNTVNPGEIKGPHIHKKRATSSCSNVEKRSPLSTSGGMNGGVP